MANILALEIEGPLDQCDQGSAERDHRRCYKTFAGLLAVAGLLLVAVGVLKQSQAQEGQTGPAVERAAPAFRKSNQSPRLEPVEHLESPPVVVEPVDEAFAAPSWALGVCGLPGPANRPLGDRCNECSDCQSGFCSEYKCSEKVFQPFLSELRYAVGKVCEQFPAEQAEGPIQKWDTSRITDMSDLFWIASETRKLNQWGYLVPISRCQSFRVEQLPWNTGRVLSMNGMFFQAHKFNGDISQWNTSSVEDMSNMFREAESFNRDLPNWDTSSVEDMRAMFLGACSFNGDISGWNTKKVKDGYMSGMFVDSYFDRNIISKWEVKTTSGMFGIS